MGDRACRFLEGRLRWTGDERCCVPPAMKPRHRARGPEGAFWILAVAAAALLTPAGIAPHELCVKVFAAEPTVH